MKRNFKIILIIFVLSFSFLVSCGTITAYAQTDDEDIYKEALSSYDFSCFEELGDSANEVLEQLGIDDFDYTKITELDAKTCIEVLWNLIKENLTEPLGAAVTILCFTVLSAFLSGFSGNRLFSDTSVYSTAASLVIAVIISVQCADTIAVACTTIEVCSDFIYAFFPVFMVIITVSGGALTSVSTNTLLLSLAQGLNLLASNIFVPLINCFLALSICSGIRSELNIDGALRVIKRVLIGIISFSAGAFVAVLSIKTAVASRADALGLRSLRFAINSVVPVIGSAISEGLLSIQSYSSLIKSSVGIVGIIGVAALFLPALINVVGWRISISISLAVSEIFDDKSVSKMLRAFSDAFLLLNVVLILAMVTTIISIGILIAAKTAV